MDVTLLVPTLNRSEYLIRLLTYYSYTKFDGRIIIGDSSDAYHLERTRNAVQSLCQNLNVQHIAYPGLSSSQTYEQLATLIDTSYVAFLGDDDFILTSGLRQCCQYLDSFSDFTAANGRALEFEVDNGDAYGAMSVSRFYPQPNLQSKNAMERFFFHMNHYTVTLFSVHRADVWKEIWNGVSLAKDNAIAGELLPCCLSAVSGKIAHLDCLYLMRQTNNLRYIEPEFYEWISNDKWLPSHDVFCHRLADLLADKEGLDHCQALSVARKGFWDYLSRGIYEAYQAKHYQSLPYWKRIALDWLGVPQLWRKVRTIKDNRKVHVEKFLNSSSSDYDAFLPFYQVVTQSLNGDFSKE